MYRVERSKKQEVVDTYSGALKRTREKGDSKGRLTVTWEANATECRLKDLSSISRTVVAWFGKVRGLRLLVTAP